MGVPLWCVTSDAALKSVSAPASAACQLAAHVALDTHVLPQLSPQSTGVYLVHRVCLPCSGHLGGRPVAKPGPVQTRCACARCCYTHAHARASTVGWLVVMTVACGAHRHFRTIFVARMPAA